MCESIRVEQCAQGGNIEAGISLSFRIRCKRRGVKQAISSIAIGTYTDWVRERIRDVVKRWYLILPGKSNILGDKIGRNAIPLETLWRKTARISKLVVNFSPYNETLFYSRIVAALKCGYVRESYISPDSHVFLSIFSPVLNYTQGFDSTAGWRIIFTFANVYLSEKCKNGRW